MKMLVILVCPGSVWEKFKVLNGNVGSLGMPGFCYAKFKVLNGNGYFVPEFCLGKI